MKREVRERIKIYIRNKRIQKRFFAVLSVLSLVVALGTFYALSIPALTLDDEAAVGISESAEASPSPSAAPSAQASANPEMIDEAESTASPAPSSSQAPEPTPEESAQPSASPSVSPSASPEASPGEENDGMHYSCSVDGLEVSVAFDALSGLPENAELIAVRVTGKNCSEYGTVSLDGIESALGVTDKSKLEYYILKFTADGAEIAMPAISRSVTIIDNQVGKKYGARAVYGVDAENGNTQLSEISASNILTENRTVTLATDDALSGLIVYWYKGAETESTEANAAIYTAETKTAKADIAAVKTDEASQIGLVENKPAESGNKSHYEFFHNGLGVEANLSDAGAVADGAELVASQITKDGDFWSYLSVFLKLYLNGYIQGDETFYAYDIHFELDGQEIEPTAGTVSVSVSDSNIGSDSPGTIQTFEALHIDDADHIEELSVDQPTLSDEDQIGFSVDSFSTFIVLPVGSRLTFDLVTQESDTFTHTSYYNSTRPLGMAGNFHIVAFNAAYLNAHTNGNVLTKTLYAYSNFGTNNLPAEVSYIQNYAAVNPTSASSTSHLLALGSTNTITLMDNGNAFGINGTKLDKPYNILQDDNTSELPFVNINLVEAEFRSILLSYSALTTNQNITSHLSTTGGSCSASYITLNSSSAVGVYNITAAQLNQYQYFGVTGFVEGGEGTVIINVDCSGYTGIVHLPNSEMQVGTTWLNFQERTTFVYGKIMWNFNNCNTTIETGRVYGTIIAPDATIKAYQNVNGTIVGKNVYIYAESHRDDFVGKLTDNMTVNKIWLDEHGAALPTADVANYSVSVQLYWSNNNGTTWHTNNADVYVLNAANKWTYTWANTHSYLWKVVEVAMTDSSGNDISGNFTASYSSNNGTITKGIIFTYNTVTYVLPETGGVTAKPFTIAGIIIMVTALYIFLKFKRRRKGQKISDTG